MCLVALAIDASHRFPLVVAANRDEFYARPTARLAWWSPGASAPDILGGRDLEAGGTWLGLTTGGRVALVTNVREPGRNDAAAPSRGEIVPLWLRGDLPTDRFWARIALTGYRGFNLVAADFARGECFWASNRAPHPLRIERGVYGLSNAMLDAPWPKVRALKARVQAALGTAASPQALSSILLDALGDRRVTPDADLPATGIALDLERALSAAFIRTPDQSYGTRSSTVIVTERRRRYLLTHVYERTHSPTSGVALMRQAVLKNWPPRYSDASLAAAAPVSDVEVPAAKKRVRSLLKPERARAHRA